MRLYYIVLLAVVLCSGCKKNDTTVLDMLAGNYIYTDTNSTAQKLRVTGISNNSIRVQFLKCNLFNECNFTETIENATVHNRYMATFDEYGSTALYGGIYHKNGNISIQNDTIIVEGTMQRTENNQTHTIEILFVGVKE